MLLTLGRLYTRIFRIEGRINAPRGIGARVSGSEPFPDGGHGLHPDYAIIVAGLVDELLKRKMPVGIHPGK
jgi:hypothetical protein